MFLEPSIGTIVLQLINFAIFFALLNVVFLRPVGKAIAARRAHIDEVHRTLEESSARAAELRAQAEARIVTARREANERVVAARAAATDEGAQIAAKAAAQAAAEVERAHATVAAELSVERAKEPAIATILAQQMLDEALGMGSAS